MYRKKINDDIKCPLEYGLRIFGGKWKPRVICLLSTREVLRYSEIRNEMHNITDAVLTSTLKELIAADIVSRVSYDEIPPRVEYSLTDKGKSIIPILHSICEWAGAYIKEMDNEELPAQCMLCDYRG